MKKPLHLFFITISIVLFLSLVGCSRTINDINKWKAKGNIEKLIKALEDPKFEIRKGAAVALGELKAVTSVDPLATLFNDSAAEVRLASIKALVAIGSDSTTPYLISALTLEAAEARAIAAAGLGVLKSTKAIEALIMALNDVEESVAYAAATALGQIGNEQASAALATLLKSSSVKLRIACIKALAYTGGEIAIQSLIGALAEDTITIHSAAIHSLVTLGPPRIPFVLEALKNNSANIRRGVISVLKKTDSIPTAKPFIIWYKLATVSVDNKTSLNMDIVHQLAQMGNDAVDTLLEASALEIADFRQHASRVLEIIGESCTTEAMTAAANVASPKGISWFNERSSWNGAPSWRIDLWAAIAALNPDFELNSSLEINLQSQGRDAFRAITAADFKLTCATIPLLINLLGDTTAPPPKQPDFDPYGMPIVKKATDRFRGEANQQIAKNKLISIGSPCIFPLIAALSSDNPLVAGHAAEILGELGDLRASEPLMVVMEQKISAGEQLTSSPFYNALQNMDDPKAEPTLLKIRPNTDRAIRIFDRQYAAVRVISAESRDTARPSHEPITFRIGFIDDGTVRELRITFAKNSDGNWIPSPALPNQLP